MIVGTKKHGIGQNDRFPEFRAKHAFFVLRIISRYHYENAGCITTLLRIFACFSPKNGEKRSGFSIQVPTMEHPWMGCVRLHGGGQDLLPLLCDSPCASGAGSLWSFCRQSWAHSRNGHHFVLLQGCGRDLVTLPCDLPCASGAGSLDWLKIGARKLAVFLSKWGHSPIDGAHFS